MTSSATTGTRPVSLGEAGTIETRQPDAPADSMADRPGGLVTRITVAAGNRVTTAEPSTGSSRSAARSIGRRSSNTTKLSNPRENNAAPTGGAKGMWTELPASPLGGRDLVATRATGPGATGSRVTGQTWIGSAAADGRSGG